jgi:hypothetical protein
VYKKYGKDAYRMFRLLSKAGRLLETDKVISLNKWICSQFHCNSHMMETTAFFLGLQCR